MLSQQQNAAIITALHTGNVCETQHAEDCECFAVHASTARAILSGYAGVPFADAVMDTMEGCPVDGDTPQKLHSVVGTALDAHYGMVRSSGPS